MQSLYLVVLLMVGTLLTRGFTAVVFAAAPGGAWWSAALLWLVIALVHLSLMTLFSVVIPAAAAGAGLGSYMMRCVAAIPFRRQEL